MRTKCFNCDNQIEYEGDAFCAICEPNFALSNDGDVITIEEYYALMEDE